MQSSSYKRRKVDQKHYKDRISLESDFEVVNERTEGRYRHDSMRASAAGSAWTLGTSWAPEDNADFALDDDGDWYDVEVEAPVLESSVAQGDTSSDPLPKGKARSQTSLRPNVVWKANSRSDYLDELLRWEGRGDFRSETACPDCTARKAASPNQPEYRCKDCFTPDLLCGSCCVRRHRLQPFHNIEKWNGEMFEKTFLADIGLEIHINHASLRCPSPEPAHKNLLVLHTNGIHRVKIMYCACHRAIPRDIQLLRRGLYPGSHVVPRTCATFQLLHLLHALTISSKLSMYDAYRALERITDGSGLRRMKKRYRPLMRIILQYRHLKMLKRAGRGHDPSGPDGTRPGQLAVRCPTCPHPGINLPDDWMNAPEGMKFLYVLIVCMDANFRLKNQLVSNYSTDPGLGLGLSYMLPREEYEKYVLSKADSDEINTCVGFQALAKATTRNSRGLRYTGVGGVFCERSEMVMPNGVGNLQKGERYSNMDYIFASAVQETKLPKIIVSYDIACQWSKNLRQRIEDWPDALKIPDTTTIRPLIPKFHEPAHTDKDHEQYSFLLAEGAANGNGEGCERVWSSENPVGNATKTQGPGSRQDVLDDHFAHWNWDKCTSMGESLLRSYKEAIIERNRQSEAHRGFMASLPKELVAIWEAMCVAWDSDPLPKTAPNPYEKPDAQLAEQKLRQELDEEDKRRAVGRGMAVNSTSSSSFLAMGLDIEESQRRVAQVAKEHSKIPANLRSSALNDQRKVLRSKIQNWEPLRLVYMPGLPQFLSETNRALTSWDSDPNPEEVELLLPSSLPVTHRRMVCVEGLPELEDSLRTAQCHDALDSLRQCLRLKTCMIHFKNRNVSGQRGGVRSRAIIDRVHLKALRQVSKYRNARAAKVKLSGPGVWETQLQPLLDGDVRGYMDPERQKERKGRKGIWEDGHQPESSNDDEETEDDSEDEDEEDKIQIDERDGLHGAGRRLPKHLRKLGTGQTRRKLSWIWLNTAISLDDDSDEQDHELLRAEWARSRARVRRAKEEVLLVVEEMRRCVEFRESEARTWENRSQGRTGVPAALAEGLLAYAVDQANIHRSLASAFKTIWKTPLAQVSSAEIDEDEDDDDDDNNGSETVRRTAAMDVMDTDL